MSPQEALKMLRTEIGLTQIELAEKLNIGLSTLNRWENGKTFPSHAHAINITRTARDMGASEECLKYLNEVLLPPRMRSRPASKLGFPALAQELLCQMVDGSPAGVVVIDEESKNIIYVNRRAEELTGKCFFRENDKHCWSYLHNLDKPCADCDPARYPLVGCQERMYTTPDGLRLKYRTRSIIWMGKKVYAIYITNETELAESKKTVSLLKSLFPAGAGIIHLYKDGRLELFRAFYHDFDSLCIKDVYRVDLKTINDVHKEDAAALLREIQGAISENRNVSALFRSASSGRWIQLYASQFWQDEEKRAFYCSFVDVDQHIEEIYKLQSISEEQHERQS